MDLTERVIDIGEHIQFNSGIQIGYGPPTMSLPESRAYSMPEEPVPPEKPRVPVTDMTIPLLTGIYEEIAATHRTLMRIEELISRPTSWDKFMAKVRRWLHVDTH